MYKTKHGNPYIGHEKVIHKSKRRGDLVSLSTKVKPLTLEVLKHTSERECISIGELLDKCIIENIDVVIRGEQ